VPTATCKRETSDDARRAHDRASSRLRRARSCGYGLVLLRHVSDGAAVALDGRFWLRAQSLDQRWLALPRGLHAITVRPPGGQPIARHVDVTPGKTLIVRF
jgi:hypothetical protein